MPTQEEHDKPENLVEESQQQEEESARSLEDAVDSHGTLEGYYAMNNIKPPAEETPEDTKKPAHSKPGHGKKD